MSSTSLWLISALYQASRCYAQIGRPITILNGIAKKACALARNNKKQTRWAVPYDSMGRCLISGETPGQTCDPPRQPPTALRPTTSIPTADQVRLFGNESLTLHIIANCPSPSHAASLF